jgi:uncharacterized protein YjhX (UPF0386 family)/uncharacterized protein YfkK (UPF0435 family)
MIENGTLWALIFASIGFLVFVYKQITTAGLKNKLLKLTVRRKHNFRQDSIDDCLENTRNQRLLSSLFYRVNLIELYVKKIIPGLIFLSIVFFILSAVWFGETIKFKENYSDEITNVIIYESDGSNQLDAGMAIFKTQEGKYIYFSANKGGIFSISNDYVLRIGFAIVVAVIAIIVVLFLAVAYFKNQSSIEDVQRSISEDIKFLKEELRIVNQAVLDNETKSAERFKDERTTALDKKMAHLNESLAEIHKIEEEIAKLAT